MEADRDLLVSWLRQLDRSQWRNPASIWRGQRRALEHLLVHARKTTPFYRGRLDPVFRGETIDLSEWNQIPIVTRADLVERNAQLMSSSVPACHGRILPVRSSGSTGEPLRMIRTWRSVLRGLGPTYRAYAWHGIDVRRRLASIRSYGSWSTHSYPNGSKSTYWSAVDRILEDPGEFLRLDIETPVEQQIEWLRRTQPTYLHTYPSNAAALARHASHPLAGLERIFLGGETISDETRDLCESRLGAPVFARYGAHDAGHLAAQCPTNTSYHLYSEVTLVEVLDSKGSPVGPGGQGRIIVTNLENYAFPLIRYELGDQVEVGEPCSCGRGLPVISRVLGRERQLFRFPDGTVVWPTITRLLEEYLSPRQWQVAQIGPQEIEVRYVEGRPDADVEFEALTRAVCDRLNQSVSVRYAKHTRIPPTPSGKYFDYICELPDS